MPRYAAATDASAAELRDARLVIARLAQLTPGQADTLLQMLAMRELLGTNLGEGLGLPRAAVDVLIGKATRAGQVPIALS